MAAPKAKTADSMREDPGPAPDFAVSDPGDQQMAVRGDQADDGQADIIDGEVVDDFAATMAAQAAQYVALKGYGPKMTEVIRYIAGRALDTAELNSVIMELMADRILNASSAEEVLDPFGTMKAAQLYGKTLWVTACQFLVSDVGEGFPWYAALTVQDPKTREQQVVTVGGEKLVPQVAAFDMRDAWPQALRIMESEKVTKAGFRVLELRSPV